MKRSKRKKRAKIQDSMSTVSKMIRTIKHFQVMLEAVDYTNEIHSAGCGFVAECQAFLNDYVLYELAAADDVDWRELHRGAKERHDKIRVDYGRLVPLMRRFSTKHPLESVDSDSSR